MSEAVGCNSSCRTTVIASIYTLNFLFLYARKYEDGHFFFITNLRDTLATIKNSVGIVVSRISQQFSPDFALRRKY